MHKSVTTSCSFIRVSVFHYVQCTWIMKLKINQVFGGYSTWSLVSKKSWSNDSFPNLNPLCLQHFCLFHFILQNMPKFLFPSQTIALISLTIPHHSGGYFLTTCLLVTISECPHRNMRPLVHSSSPSIYSCQNAFHKLHKCILGS